MADKMTQADFDIYIATFAASLDRENSLLRTENAALTIALAESRGREEKMREELEVYRSLDKLSQGLKGEDYERPAYTLGEAAP